LYRSSVSVKFSGVKSNQYYRCYQIDQEHAGTADDLNFLWQVKKPRESLPGCAQFRVDNYMAVVVGVAVIGVTVDVPV
jgi:UDP-N-acetylmuramyl tripeptide synthase